MTTIPHSLLPNSVRPFAIEVDRAVVRSLASHSALTLRWLYGWEVAAPATRRVSTAFFGERWLKLMYVSEWLHAINEGVSSVYFAITVAMGEHEPLRMLEMDSTELAYHVASELAKATNARFIAHDMTEVGERLRFDSG
jgi:hypothetical protein